MKIEHRGQVEVLAKFRSVRFLTTSFYLDWDKGRLTKKEIGLSLKNLLQKGRERIQGVDLSRERKESLSADLDLINAHCQGRLTGSNYPGLALFSCSGEKFWKEFELGASPRNRLLFDHNPYVNPLAAIVEESLNICALLLDRREARWFALHGGEARALESLSSDVPSRVKGGFMGAEEKRIDRHVAAHLQDHFKKAAQATFDLFKTHAFDALFLGCADEHRAEVEGLLHPYVKNKLRGALRLKPGAGPDKVLKASLELEKALLREDEDRLLAGFTSELKKGGLAVSGLRDALRSLNAGGVASLLVSRDISAPGRLCPRCRLLYLEETVCPSCHKPTDTVLDVVDEAVEMAMDKKARVKHFDPASRLDRYGKIGALLRYKS